MVFIMSGDILINLDRSGAAPPMANARPSKPQANKFTARSQYKVVQECQSASRVDEEVLLPLLRSEIRLSGGFRRNLLQGHGVLLLLRSGERVEGHFRDSCLHGLARRTDPDGNLAFVGRYRNGRPVGKCWRMTRSEMFPADELEISERNLNFRSVWNGK